MGRANADLTNSFGWPVPPGNLLKLLVSASISIFAKAFPGHFVLSSHRASPSIEGSPVHYGHETVSPPARRYLHSGPRPRGSYPSSVRPAYARPRRPGGPVRLPASVCRQSQRRHGGWAVISGRPEDKNDTSNRAADDTSSVDRILHSVLRGHELRLLRFVFFGVLSGLLYAIIVWAGVTKFGALPLVMNVVGYLLVLPLNFFLNRNYTFRGAESLWKQTRRFLVVHILNISATSGVYVIVGLLHAPLSVGVIGALIVVPITQYLALDRWVFRSARI